MHTPQTRHLTHRRFKIRRKLNLLHLKLRKRLIGLLGLMLFGYVNLTLHATTANPPDNFFYILNQHDEITQGVIAAKDSEYVYVVGRNNDKLSMLYSSDTENLIYNAEPSISADMKIYTLDRQNFQNVFAWTETNISRITEAQGWQTITICGLVKDEQETECIRPDVDLNMTGDRLEFAIEALSEPQQNKLAKILDHQTPIVFRHNDDKLELVGYIEHIRAQGKIIKIYGQKFFLKGDEYIQITPISTATRNKILKIKTDAYDTSEQRGIGIMMEDDDYKIRITDFEKWFHNRLDNFTTKVDGEEKMIKVEGETIDGRDLIEEIYIPDPTTFSGIQPYPPSTDLLKTQFNYYLKRENKKQQRNDDQCIDGRIGLKLLSKDKSITEDKTYWLEGCWFPYN